VSPPFSADEAQTLPANLEAFEAELPPGSVDRMWRRKLLVHQSDSNRSGDRRIGVGISYIPCRVRHTGSLRMRSRSSGTLDGSERADQDRWRGQATLRCRRRDAQEPRLRSPPLRRRAPPMPSRTDWPTAMASKAQLQIVAITRPAKNLQTADVHRIMLLITADDP
jgi:hypothetical protein